ncbi:uncharacterized protein TRUGW13939_05582 [Talaromyces rugulosus]|uniref:DUF1214 domain-containing protein n=1 Tax=Talaromyces rugulosus TaxID=121627 RepID=A0A7H8QXR2_TALRU|nr:uncharacterized protein TRUGW13939_05582 [Talaromyces rugulosus]QKX58458.1 hypothetical protein TRUGW13939_05582 [Talaromyces rugulosus]
MFNERNQPFNTTDSAYVQSQLKAAGIHGGAYVKPFGVNLTKAFSLFEDSINEYLATNMVNLTNGWETNTPQGLYESEYEDRAVMGKIGYLEQTIDQALYPVRGTETMNLTNDQSYIYTFNSKPPVQSFGFWSLTLYDATGTLVENPEDKYTDYATSDDGIFQILVQPYSNPPPSNWTNNWLPAPAGALFSVMLRLYGPTEDFQNGKWEYPVIIKGDAFVA